jgi:1-acyl-sn-glycerol-3-phosphate acyltransferase
MERAIPDLTVGADDLPAGFPHPWPVRGDGARPLRYHVTAATCRAVLRSFYGPLLRLEGLENVPRQGGPLIIASNHLSNLDPMIVGGFTPGPNSAMAKVELFTPAAMAWIFGGCNCFPVVRGSADRWALRTGLALLEHGARLILWVEGTRAEKPGMKRVEPGVGFLLRRRPVPVLPVGITGTEAALLRGRRLPQRVPITVRFGVPVRLDLTAPGSKDNQEVADRVGALVAAQLPEAYRGVYSERAAAILAGAAA